MTSIALQFGLVPIPAPPPRAIRRVSLMPSRTSPTNRSLTTAQRRALILEALRLEGPGTVSEVAVSLSLPYDRTRKDFIALEKSGAIRPGRNTAQWHPVHLHRQPGEPVFPHDTTDSSSA